MPPINHGQRAHFANIMSCRGAEEGFLPDVLSYRIKEEEETGKGSGLRKSSPVSARWEQWRHHMAMGCPQRDAEMVPWHYRRVDRQDVCCHIIIIQEDFSVQAMYSSISLNLFYLLPLHGRHAETAVKFL